MGETASAVVPSGSEKSAPRDVEDEVRVEFKAAPVVKRNDRSFERQGIAVKKIKPSFGQRLGDDRERPTNRSELGIRDRGERDQLRKSCASVLSTVDSGRFCLRELEQTSHEFNYVRLCFSGN